METGGCLSDLTSTRHITAFTVEELYLCMGRELESLTEVPAGNIIGLFTSSFFFLFDLIIHIKY